MSSIIEKIEKKYEQEHPEFNVGDNVKVSIKVVEGKKTRIQNFEGTVIQKGGKGTAASFTVLKQTRGSQDTVEKTFPMCSPSFEKIVVTKPRKKVPRAKLYYLRKEKQK